MRCPRCNSRAREDGRIISVDRRRAEICYTCRECGLQFERTTVRRVA